MIEDLRLTAAKRFAHFDLTADAALNEITELASSIADTPFSFITLLDDAFTHFNSLNRKSENVAASLKSLCLLAVSEDNALVIPNMRDHHNLKYNPLVNDDPGMIFYAGTPLTTCDGFKIGTLCVLDTQPHNFNEYQQQTLKVLANQVIRVLEYKLANELLKKQQAALEKHAELITDASTRLRSFFESSRNFHVLINQDGQVIDFNKAAYNFIKNFYKTELKRGDNFIEYIRPEFISTYVRKYNQALQGNNSIEKGSTKYEGLDEIFWEASFEAAYDMENNIIGVSYIIRNVTEQKLKEKRIIEQTQSLLKIAHIQAHEFRGPLATLMGLIYLIKTDTDQRVYDYLPMLDEAVNKLDTAIRTIVHDTETGTSFGDV